jgi:hypothetical protein
MRTAVEFSAWRVDAEMRTSVVVLNHKIIKRKKGNFANFLSISSNQTNLLLSVCLVPGLDFSATPVSISAVSLVL